MKKTILLIILLSFVGFGFARSLDSLEGAIELVRLKYGGGGDWYEGPSSLPNLARYVSENTPVPIFHRGRFVEPMSSDLYSYPLLYMTGHGNINFSHEEAARLRRYFENGGFLLANDSYGMDQAFRREIKKVFPDSDLVELPFDHEIFHIYYSFPGGLPKIHEHDGKPPQGFAIFHEERMVVFYVYESDIGDGWEDEEVHNNPPEKREQALKMGANIIIYALTN